VATEIFGLLQSYILNYVMAVSDLGHSYFNWQVLCAVHYGRMAQHRMPPPTRRQKSSDPVQGLLAGQNGLWVEASRAARNEGLAACQRPQIRCTTLDAKEN
jgi:hypothetical protein